MRKFITQKIYKYNFNKIGYASFKACIAFFCCIFLASNSYAKTNFLVKNKFELDQIEEYLNNIKNLSADFMQKSEDGKAQGKFFLSRPGKMRVEYNKGPKILIVVNGSVLTYKDLELDEISNLGTNTTPASFLTRPHISFSAKDVEVVDFSKNDDFMKVSVIKKNGKEAGEFSLVFKNEPLGFVKMEVKNDLGQVTEITLKNIDFPNEIDNNLFYIRNKNLPF